MPIAVRVDIQRQRVKRGLLTFGADGYGWDFYNLSNSVIDPVTLTTILKPEPLEDDFATNGAYTRYTRTDYRKVDGTTTPPATEWVENNRRFNGDVYLENLGVNYPLYTASSLGINRGVYLSWYVPETSNLSAIALEFGWGEVGVSTTVSCRVYAGGSVEVYKGTTKVGDYSLSGITELRKQQAGTSATKGDVVGRIINLLCIPARRRELLVFNTAGGGFSHVFEDLDPTIINTITVSGRFWWSVPTGAGSVQFMPLRYRTSGYAVSPSITTREALAIGTTLAGTLFADGAGAGTTSANTLMVQAGSVGTAFTPDGTVQDVRVKVNMTGDGNYTPFVYAAFVDALPETANTANSPTDIASHVSSVRFSVPDGPSPTEATVNITPQTSEASPVTGIRTQNNRPIRIDVDSDYLMFGVTRKPSTTEGRLSDWGTFGVSDLWAQLDATVYEEAPTPFDGTALTTIIERLLTHAGIPAGERDVESSAYTLDLLTGASKGEWLYQPKIGDKVSDWITKLHSEFAATWYIGFYPTATGTKFRFRSESGMGTTPKAHIYLSRAGDTDKKACRKFRQEVLPPEATRVSVVGYDPRKKLLIRDSTRLTSLEDPTTAVGSRPDGWLGQVQPYGLFEPRLTSVDSVAQATDNLVEKLTVSQTIAEWESTLLLDSDGVPLWKGDVVSIHPFGDYRIISFGGTLDREATGATFRRINYVGKLIDDEVTDDPDIIEEEPA